MSETLLPGAPTGMDGVLLIRGQNRPLDLGLGQHKEPLEGSALALLCSRGASAWAWGSSRPHWFSPSDHSVRLRLGVG